MFTQFNTTTNTSNNNNSGAANLQFNDAQRNRNIKQVHHPPHYNAPDEFEELQENFSSPVTTQMQRCNDAFHRIIILKKARWLIINNIVAVLRKYGSIKNVCPVY